MAQEDLFGDDETVLGVPEPGPASYASEDAWAEEPLEEDFDYSEFTAPPAPEVEHPVFETPEAALASLEEDPRTLELFLGLNPAQAEAVRELLGPVLVIAGPGSGKTRVLTHRIAALVELGVPPWQVMAVTFTNKAAGEMRERIAGLVGDELASEMWVSTFHSMCARILRQYHAVAGLPRSFTILDSSDSQKVVKGILTEAGAPAEASAVKEIHSAISRAKNSGRTPEDLGNSMRPSDRADAKFMYLYNQRLAEMGSVDFDDLLCLTVKVLATHEPALTWVRKRSRFLLVDEVQDTNAVQVALLRLISPPTEPCLVPVGPATVSSYLRGSSGNICVVGDADQSIYAWRSADPAALLAFVDEFPTRKVVVLEQNYRSTKAILETVQAIIDPNPTLRRPRLFTENPQGEPVRLYIAEDDRDEASWVVSEVKRTGDPVDHHAVLFRTNAQTRVFEEELTRAGMPYQVVGALKFYDRAEVKDALSYLRSAMNPADAVNLARCINTPRRGLGDAAVASLLAHARTLGTDPISALRSGLASGTFPGRSAKSLQAFLDIHDLVRLACEDGPAAALKVVAEDAGLRSHLLLDKQSGLDRVENLDELIASAESFLAGPSPTSPETATVGDLPGLEQTLAFLENVALVSAADTGEDEVVVRKLSLLTAHSAKGKEFPHVFVAGVEDGLYPHTRSQGDELGEQEERRLLFVATSRAEKTLSISRCKTRYVYKQQQSNPASPFLADLPDTVVTVRSKRVARPAPPTQRFGSPYAASAYSGRSTFPQRSAAPVASRSASPIPTPLGVKKAAPAAGPRLDPSTLSVGARVSHSVFGEGTVDGVDGSKATITFDEKGQKVLDLSFAPLSLV